jgi:hypothetical protein
MKTKLNITRIASAGIASAALILLAGVLPVQAGTRNTETDAGIAAASFRLDGLTLAIENAIRFVAPAVSTEEEMKVIEVEAAEFRMDELNNSIEKEIRFSAPAVDVKAEADEHEINQAVERLDKLNDVIEGSLRYQAPAADTDASDAL